MKNCLTKIKEVRYDTGIMTEPVSTSSAALATVSYTTGITVFGAATGLRADLIIAALAGAMLRASYNQTPMSNTRRVLNVTVATLVGAVLSPAATAWITGLDMWPKTVSHEMAGLPIAVALGYLAPKLAALLDRKVDSQITEKPADKSEGQ